MFCCAFNDQRENTACALFDGLLRERALLVCLRLLPDRQGALSGCGDGDGDDGCVYGSSVTTVGEWRDEGDARAVMAAATC